MNLSFILQLAAATAAAGMALAMFFWSEKSPARWLFAVGMGTLALESAFGALCTDAVHPESVAYWQQWRLLTRALLPSVWLAFSLTYSRGNYRDFLHRWRWVLAISLLLPVGLSAGFHREMIAGIHQIPPAQEWFVQLGWPGLAQSAVNLLAAVLTLMNLERTYRAAVGTMRWRIKYVILGVGLLFAGRIYSSSQVLLFSGVNPTFGAVNATALLAACLLILRSLLRKGVFSVDIYPSHTFLSASVVIVLAGVYLMAVGLLAKLSTVFGGDTAFPLKAFLVFAALVGLAMLVMSDRLRDFAQRFVSRHLSRPRYDYRKVWQTFTQKTTSRLTSEDLCRAVAEWLSETFNVLSVTIWLVDESGRRLRFGASTSLTPPGANRLAPSPADLRGAINALKNNPLPVDIDATSADWARPLRQINPHHFQAGGSRVCVPVAAGGELLGVVTLGDRVGGLAFSLEDFELLKCIGDQVGSNLLSLRLSDKLAQGKELEAFQTMSAFFVHDLKNTAHTLAL
ncbi:MAG TPA: GAF domain-containing protein, partial [Methylomirabilota bacterium]|nr:GAF domain-containing protein [Methylomirabilota bacterium]